MRRHRNRIAAACCAAVFALVASGCQGEANLAEIGNAVCDNYTAQLASASRSEESDVAQVKMLVIHLAEANALGKIDDQRVKNMASLQERIALLVRKRISGAPTDLNLPAGWEDALHATWAEIGLERCALRGAEYPGTGFGADIAPGTPPAPGAQPIPGYDEPEGVMINESRGDLFAIAPAAAPEAPAAQTTAG